MGAVKFFLVLSFGLTSFNARAFFAQTDQTEVYTVLPSETAIWIFDQTDDPQNQVETNSLAYLQAHKIFLRQVEIPHSKLRGSNGKSWFSFWDYYVPDGRLIIVDRMPVAVQWRNDGTNEQTGRDMSLHCSTKDGLSVAAGVAIVAAIRDDQASQYLYYFGLERPRGDPNAQSVTFTSVYKARELTPVLLSFGHAFIHSALCREFHSRTLDQANHEAGDIMKNVAKDVRETFAKFGVTVTSLGWADNFGFAPEVQSSINRVYISEREVEASEHIKLFYQSLKQLSGVELIREFGLRTNGALPRTLLGRP